MNSNVSPRQRARVLVVSTFVFLISTTCIAESVQPVSATLGHLKIEAGKTDSPARLVTWNLPESLIGKASVVIQRTGEMNSIIQQRSKDQKSITFEAPEIRAGKSLTLEVVETTFLQIYPTSGLTITKDKRDLMVHFKKRHVLTYNHAVDSPPEGVDAIYRRSGYIHPLNTPSGITVTDAFPADHRHQHAVFFAWVNTQFRGHKVDFWNQHKRTGNVEHVKIVSTATGPLYAEFTAELKHVDMTAPEMPFTALNETWNVRVFGSDTNYILDIESRQRAASDEPLLIKDYHYGGMGFRGAESWASPGRHFLTSEGLDRIEGNHTRPRWVIMHGESGGKHASLLAMSDATNFRCPQPVRLHPKMPYFCFAPCVLGDFKIEPGQVYRSRYRVVVHDGMPEPSTINRLEATYRNQPTVKFTALLRKLR